MARLSRFTEVNDRLAPLDVLFTIQGEVNTTTLTPFSLPSLGSPFWEDATAV